MWWQDGRIIGEAAILAEAVSQENLGNAVGVVGWLTNSVGPDLTKRFGGNPTSQAAVDETTGVDGTRTGPGGLASGTPGRTANGFGPEPAALNRGTGSASGGTPSAERHLPPAACPPGYL